MHKRQILPKEDDRRWPHQKDPIQRSYYVQRPIMAFPPYHSNHTLSPAPVYPVWGQSGSQPAGVQMWGPPGYPVWRPTENWHWKPYPAVILGFSPTAVYISFLPPCFSNLLWSRTCNFNCIDAVQYVIIWLIDVPDACWCMGLPCVATYSSSLLFLLSSEYQQIKEFNIVSIVIL